MIPLPAGLAYDFAKAKALLAAGGWYFRCVVAWVCRSLPPGRRSVWDKQDRQRVIPDNCVPSGSNCERA